MFIRAKYVLQFSRRNDLENTGIDPAIENRRIVWTFMFEAGGRKVACENSRPSSLPVQVAFHGCSHRLEGKQKVAFHTLLCSERFFSERFFSGNSGFPLSSKTNIWFDLIYLIYSLPN